ncbi:MAG TPA: L,D-transpeptidase [Baekduia sp.]|nr:L,D-transpeptidase [Baekduia sp.]
MAGSPKTLFVAVASAIALAICLTASSSYAAEGPADPFELTPRTAHLAQVIYPTVARSKPGGGARRGRLGTEARWGGGPVRLLVLGSALDERARRWLRVRLPERPNDRSGWILADHTRQRSTPWRIVISLNRRTLTVRRSGKIVRRFGAVVGAQRTPTPRGLFAIGERIRQPAGVLGPWALHLTAHSSVLDDFGGGKGRVAIHGRSGQLLSDPLGSAASHGCVRIDNAAISWLASRAIEGTPVVVER